MAAQKRGAPVDEVVEKGIQIKIYSSPNHGRESFLISYYLKGKRVMARSPSLEKARARAREVIDQLQSGVAHDVTFSGPEAARIMAAVETVRRVGVSLLDAVREYAEARQVLAGQPLVVEAARFFAAHQSKIQADYKSGRLPVIVEEFVAAIESGGRSARYVEDCRARLRKAAGAFQTDIRDVKASDLERWLDSIKASGRNRNNFRGALVTLFSFARSRGYLPRGEQTEAEHLMKSKSAAGEILIYTPEEFQTMLNGLDDRFLPMAALGGLAGLRTAEIHRLEWEEIVMEPGHIVIAAHKAKTASRRLVPILPALRRILKPIAKKSGPVVPRYSKDAVLIRAFHESFPEGVELKPNGLRHSFASYRLAAVKSADQVALEMGNSPQKLFQNYRELVTEKAAARWFNVHVKRK